MTQNSMQQTASNEIQPSYDGYLDNAFNIKDELQRRSSDVEKLARLTNILRQLPAERIHIEATKLQDAVAAATGSTKAIIDHMISLHEDFVTTVMELGAKGDVTREGYASYLVQGWYHTRYTPKFEHMFTARLGEHFAAAGAQQGFHDFNAKDNKFAKLAVHNIDEEEGHELWALQDLVQLNVKDTIDVFADVHPETKAIVWAQHDRLTRLPFIGFLGYSFYLEFMIATHSLTLVDLLRHQMGSEREDNRFIYFHYLVDQGHSVDNIQLLDKLVRTDADMREVIDNMNFIHAMYKGMTLRSLTARV